MTAGAAMLVVAALFGVLVYLCGSDEPVSKPDPIKVVEDGLHLRDYLPGGSEWGDTDDLP